MVHKESIELGRAMEAILLFQEFETCMKSLGKEDPYEHLASVVTERAHFWAHKFKDRAFDVLNGRKNVSDMA